MKLYGDNLLQYSISRLNFKCLNLYVFFSGAFTVYTLVYMKDIHSNLPMHIPP